jgi:hypothetical protein
MGEKFNKGMAGAVYIDSMRLKLKKIPTCWEKCLFVEQHPVNPWTYQCGFLIGVGKKFEFMTELGSNFEDASIIVLNLAYRF